MKQDKLYKNLILPLIIYLGVFLIYPFLYAIIISFKTQYGFGFENFRRLFTEPLFSDALGNNIVIPIISISIEMVLGIALAVTVDRVKKYRWIFVCLIMIPFVLPEIVFLTASRFIFAEHGYINGLAFLFGVEPVYWLKPGSFLSVILVSIVDAWRLTPLVFLIILAALKNIPEEIEEQAKIDGASERQIFLFVILPMLTPAIVAALILRSVDGLRVFATPLVLTGIEGVPVMSSFAYHMWSDYADTQMACASSVMLALLILASSFIYVRLWRRSGQIQI